MRRTLMTGFTGAVASLSMLALWDGARPAIGAQDMERLLPVPPVVSELLSRSCRNCHSEQTVYPWYSRIPVVSTIIEEDVTRARRAFNLSQWPASREPEETAAALRNLCEQVREGVMPLGRYTLLHPSARPSREETAALCEWTEQQARRSVSAAAHQK